MIVPLEKPSPPQNGSAWARFARSTEGPDRLVNLEEEMKREIPYIRVASSIAETYAQRMRAFQRTRYEPRAIATFTLGVEWMKTYAGWSTSGGEGAALSRESDEFRKALAHEFGYDPTEDK